MPKPAALTPLNVPELLRQYGLRPDKRLGQHFLADPAALERVVSAAGLQGEEAVLEIGAGLGSLTRYLAMAAGRVVAVELDRDLLPPLRRTLQGFENVSIVEGDILELDPAQLMASAAYRVVANIPYHITSALIRHLMEARLKPDRAVLTLQREVAMRITAPPGRLSLLALSVQVYSQPSIAARIPPGAFFPPPEVESAVLRLDLLPQPVIPAHLLEAFFRLAKAGFSQKRKTLRNSLAAGLAWPPSAVEGLLAAAEIQPSRRPESLSLEEWRRLTERFASPPP